AVAFFPAGSDGGGRQHYVSTRAPAVFVPVNLNDVPGVAGAAPTRLSCLGARPVCRGSALPNVAESPGSRTGRSRRKDAMSIHSRHPRPRTRETCAAFLVSAAVVAVPRIAAGQIDDKVTICHISPGNQTN